MKAKVRPLVAGRPQRARALLYDFLRVVRRASWTPISVVRT
ncbi:MAG: hypothetical protein OXO52_11470 [Rhodospirillales bacterium]|nr:hypothetical protein [Rhodospirillales bacterium]MDE0382163.1 hypothetical protein [Rhodospirillales bacterium]